MKEALIVASNDLSIDPRVDAPGQEQAPVTVTFYAGRKGKAGVRYTGSHRRATGEFGCLAIPERQG